MVTAKPTSLIDGIFELAAHQLGVASVSHRSALLKLQPFDGAALVSAMYRAVQSNYDESGASANKDRSKQNWRWHVPQPQIGERNRSPEVIIERAVASACLRLGRTDWSNQIPVASGLVNRAGDGRRAIDLVRRMDERRFQIIELKIASDTPLYAAVELLGYACLWLIARADRPSRPSALLDADCVDFRVLAPADFYARYSLRAVESQLNQGVGSLGVNPGVKLSFGFDVLDARIRYDETPDPMTLLELMDRPAPLHPA